MRRQVNFVRSSGSPPRIGSAHSSPGQFGSSRIVEGVQKSQKGRPSSAPVSRSTPSYSPFNRKIQKTSFNNDMSLSALKVEGKAIRTVSTHIRSQILSKGPLKVISSHRHPYHSARRKMNKKLSRENRDVIFRNGSLITFDQSEQDSFNSQYDFKSNRSHPHSFNDRILEWESHSTVRSRDSENSENEYYSSFIEGRDVDSPDSYTIPALQFRESVSSSCNSYTDEADVKSPIVDSKDREFSSLVSNRICLISKPSSRRISNKNMVNIEKLLRPSETDSASNDEGSESTVVSLGQKIKQMATLDSYYNSLSKDQKSSTNSQPLDTKESNWDEEWGHLLRNNHELLLGRYTENTEADLHVQKVKLIIKESERGSHFPADRFQKPCTLSKISEEIPEIIVSEVTETIEEESSGHEFMEQNKVLDKGYDLDEEEKNVLSDVRNHTNKGDIDPQETKSRIEDEMTVEQLRFDSTTVHSINYADSLLKINQSKGDHTDNEQQNVAVGNSSDNNGLAHSSSALNLFPENEIMELKNIEPINSDKLEANICFKLISDRPSISENTTKDLAKPMTTTSDYNKKFLFPTASTINDFRKHSSLESYETIKSFKDFKLESPIAPPTTLHTEESDKSVETRSNESNVTKITQKATGLFFPNYPYLEKGSFKMLFPQKQFNMAPSLDIQNALELLENEELKEKKRNEADKCKEEISDNQEVVKTSDELGNNNGKELKNSQMNLKILSEKLLIFTRDIKELLDDSSHNKVEEEPSLNRIVEAENILEEICFREKRKTLPKDIPGLHRACNEKNRQTEDRIQKNLELIRKILDDKRELTEKCEKLANEININERKHIEKIKLLAEKHLLELKNMKERMSTDEQSRREKWTQQKAKLIKDSSYRSLETKMKDILAKHRDELNSQKEQHWQQTREAEEKWLQRMRDQEEQLKSKFEKEVEEHSQRERERNRERYSQELQQSELVWQNRLDTLQKQFLRTQLEKEEEIQRQNMRLKADHDDELRTLKRENESLKDEFEEKFRALIRNHENEVSNLKRSHERAQNEWREQILKDLEETKHKSERELREKLRRQRDKEIEKAIREIQQEMNLQMDENKQTADAKIKNLRERYEAEMSEIETSERISRSRYLEMKGILVQKEEEIVYLRARLHTQILELKDFQQMFQVQN